uniref:Calpastatin n=2 Tax=Bursaphelenchus xylophilus TaxID=6326 RepID=A0A1I7S9P9_BURXY
MATAAAKTKSLEKVMVATARTPSAEGVRAPKADSKADVHSKRSTVEKAESP